jgi:hypothetical protein
MSSSQPDLELDVIVRHMEGDLERGDQWAVFVGANKRLELADQQRAMVFARLLADLLQRRVWVCHDACGALMPFDQSQVRGCSCC